MKSMNNKILEQLEFNKVKELLLPYLKTEQSQEELLELEPMTEAPKIEKVLMKFLTWNRFLLNITHLA
ncbi:hypothetical protein HMPREF1228_1428 [Streptococcus pyogenes GA41345]|nr:hypothetical protein HMPREF1228_1428 [Streptococcus pyogenes GA41345]